MLNDSLFGGNGVDETISFYGSRQVVCSQYESGEPLDETFGHVIFGSMAIL